MINSSSLKRDSGDISHKLNPITESKDLNQGVNFCSSHNHPSKHLCVIGITGTNGKTTVSHLINHVLNENGCNSFVLGTLNSKNPNLSTPEPEEIYEVMLKHLKSGGTHFVLEVTSEGIDQGRINDIEFDVKLLTNITPDHLDYHLTFNAYKKTKLGFMREGECTRIYPEAFTEIPLEYPILLPGKFNKLNAKAAMAVLLSLDIPPQVINKSLGNCRPPLGRMESIDCGQLFSVFIDYAHSHDALENALKAARDVAKPNGGRVLVLFGCGGDRDETRRPMMAAVAERLSDGVVLTNDNPRGENSQTIISDIVKGFSSSFKHYKVILNRSEAIEYIVSLAKPGDVVLLSGKGHEKYQVFGDNIHVWDEHAEAVAAINKTLSGISVPLV